MKKILSFLLLFCILVSITVPVFATEVTEPSEGGETVSEVTEPSETTEPTEGDTEPSEPSESTPEVTEPSEPTEPPTSSPEPSEPLTVNVSEDSIMAIADAVSSDGVPTIANKNGYAVPLYLDIPEYWDDYTYHLIGSRGTAYYYFFSNNDELMYLYSGSIEKVMNVSQGYYLPSNTSDMLYGTDGQIGDKTNWVYSDFDFRNASGLVLWEADILTSYTVTFDTGFDDLSVDPVTVEFGSSIVAPELSYEGYKFCGWYFDKEFSLPFSSDFQLDTNTTLYAKWTAYRNITFITNIEGFELDSVQVLSGEPYTLPSFSYAGYEFVGAYTDEDFEHQFVGGTIVDSDLTLYLRFEEIVFDFGALLAEQNALIKEQNERMEGLVYVQMAQGIMLSVIIIALFVFRKRDGLGC